MHQSEKNYIMSILF